MITWTKTETRTVEEKCTLRVHGGVNGGACRDATPADVIAAIEADEELRDDVVAHIAGRLETELVTHSAAVRTRLAAAESDRDAWKERAERAERERDEARTDRDAFLADYNRQLDMLTEADRTIAELNQHLDARAARIARVTKERDEAHTIAGLASAITRVEQAEKERDEARALNSAYAADIDTYRERLQLAKLKRGSSACGGQ